MAETTLITIVVYLAGTLFVILFAEHFFNNPTFPNVGDIKNVLDQEPKISPALPKHVAEKSRYHFYLVSFILRTIALYLFVSLLFPLLILDEIEVSYSVALVLGTLAFISFSPKIPYIGKILTEWKEDLHKQAEIPDRAMYVFDSLRFSEINKSSEPFRKHLDSILNSKIGGKIRDDIERNDFYFDKDRIERKWARLTYLIHIVELWSKDPQFKRHLKTESLRWLALHSHYFDSLVPKMKLFKQGLMDEDSIITTKDSIDVMSIKVYWLVTLLLFMASKADEDPCVHLKRIGWIVTSDRYFNFSGKQVVFTGFATFFSILVGALVGAAILLKIPETGLAPPLEYNITPETISRWIIYGIFMFVTPLIVTMFAKRTLSMNGTWGVQLPDDPPVPFFRRPWGIYFVVGLASYALTVIVLLAIFLLMISIGINQTIGNPILTIMAYGGLSLIASLFICYLIDTPAPGWETNWRYYVASIGPAVFQGVLNVFLVTFIFFLLNGNSFNPATLEPQQKGQLLIFDVIVLIIGIAMYFTSRIGTRFYERRENGVKRSTEGWWTICINSIFKRVETMELPGNMLGIIADDELRDLARIGDTIEFYDRNRLAKTGNIKEIINEQLRISLPT